MKISIVVPVFNEADNIFSLLEQIERAMSQAQAYEIIYVDDGSQDQTGAQLIQALQKFPRLRVIRHQQRYGQSTAIHTGVRAANYPWIATLDGDGQNDPGDILHLIDVFTHKVQAQPNLWMVAGFRNQRRDASWRLFCSWFANTVRAALLGDETPDTGCGIKLFLRDKFLLLPFFNHMHRFLPTLMIRAGGAVISEPVRHRPRINGQSKYAVLDRLGVGVIDLLGVMWLQKRSRIAIAEEVKRE
ncbi:MAG: dolichol-phosphate mannosyltransferase [Gammaproteobacteria bacterium HGW-Gammaproteobacteria-3]|nr:MAG: dolichol-phosphate mannosyltransferase [Gammaproteobacteria bacterium HGW-Gammaproteobacteria-3]